MSHSYNKIWIHSIWSTKQRHPLISPDIENKLYGYMREQFIEVGCPVRIINGMPDHVHCLFLLNPQKAITDIIKQVKGSSSHWATESESNIIDEKFAWQTGYGAYSVSESQLDKVFNYIKNQKQHHKTVSFENEFEEFIKVHGLQSEQT